MNNWKLSHKEISIWHLKIKTRDIITCSFCTLCQAQMKHSFIKNEIIIQELYFCISLWCFVVLFFSWDIFLLRNIQLEMQKTFQASALLLTCLTLMLSTRNILLKQQVKLQSTKLFSYCLISQIVS